jgi:hemerythrin
MQFVEWKESYNIGVKEIDNQHRGLFDLIGKLDSSRSYETVGKYFFLTLNKFVEYAQIHFSTEERYIDEAQYPQAREHRREHILFIEQVTLLMQKVEHKESGSEDRTLVFLKEWYLKHIVGSDRDLEQWFRTRKLP